LGNAWSWRRPGEGGLYTVDRIEELDDRVIVHVGGARRATTADHVVPKAKGGTDAMTNLVAACVQCNSGKRDKVVFLDGRKPDPPLENGERDGAPGSTMRRIGPQSAKVGNGA
jgi:hypothetical protein